MLSQKKKTPSSSRPTTGTRSTAPALLGHTLSGDYSASSSYKSRCLLPFVPGSLPSVPRPCAPTRGHASIYPLWVQVCPPLSKGSKPCSTCPHTIAGSSPPAAVIVCASAPTRTLPALGHRLPLPPRPTTIEETYCTTGWCYGLFMIGQTVPRTFHGILSLLPLAALFGRCRRAMPFKNKRTWTKNLAVAFACAR